MQEAMALQVWRLRCANSLVGLMCFIVICASRLQAEDIKNYRPIIGVLAQASYGSMKQHGDTFFHDSYVKYLEMGGARVVPVRTNETDDYYNKLFSHINGVLFPGGGVDILTSGYARAAQKIYKLAVEAKDNGGYFPLWGTCLGFQLLSALRTRKNILRECDAENILMPLYLAPGYKNSRMFHGMSDSIMHTLTTSNVTANFHHECLTPENFQNSSAMTSFFDILSVNKDKKGLEFISMMEAKNYPFYGSQWHMEKSVFTWDVTVNLNHSADSVRVTQYFADFFVNECRKSAHHFPSLAEESQALISNWHPVFEGAPSFVNNYYFNYTKRTSSKSTESTARDEWVLVNLRGLSYNTDRQYLSLDLGLGTMSMLRLLVLICCMATFVLIVSRIRNKGTQVTVVQHFDRTDHKGAPATHVEFA